MSISRHPTARGTASVPVRAPSKGEALSSAQARLRILQVVRAIAVGEVAGYGDVARRAGLPGRARLVARVLSGNDDPQLPWHRVVRSDGRLPCRKARKATASNASACARRASRWNVAVCAGPAPRSGWMRPCGRLHKPAVIIGSIPKDAAMPQLPPITKALLIANIGLFLLQWAVGDLSAGVLPSDSVLSWLMLWPLSNGFDAFSPGASFMPWQLLTYAFLHGGFNHLFFNMLALFMFGAPLEQTWGHKRFLTYYLVCVAGAGLCQLLMAWFTQSGAPVVGASGGVFGLLLAYGMLFPNQRVMLLFPPIPMKARTFVIVFGAIELLLGATGWQPGVAHFAHLGGMLFGWLMIRYWRGQSPFGGSGGRKGGGKRKPPLRVVR